MKRYETERLILRPFKERDLNDLYDYAKNDKVGPMAGWNPHKNIEESAIILKHFMKDKNILAIFHKADKKVIGSIGIRKDLKRDYNYCASLGFALDENYWGQGLICEASKEIMKYVFEDLKLNILSVEHFPSNLQSKRVIEKLGFKYEGQLREAIDEGNGIINDIVCYSMTKKEYESFKNKNFFNK